MLTLSAVIQIDEDMYVAECRRWERQARGKTIEDAAKNLREATELYLEEFTIKRKEMSFINFEMRSKAGESRS